jgi:hypothetical protein
MASRTDAFFLKPDFQVAELPFAYIATTCIEDGDLLRDPVIEFSLTALADNTGCISNSAAPSTCVAEFDVAFSLPLQSADQVSVCAVPESCHIFWLCGILIFAIRRNPRSALFMRPHR